MSIPTVETMRNAIAKRAHDAPQAGTVYGVFYVDNAGSHVLCEFDGCVSFETYATLAKAQARAVECSARYPGSYVAAPVPAGIACHIDGAVVRSGGDDVAWHPVCNGGWYEVHLDAAPAMVPQPVQTPQADASTFVSLADAVAPVVARPMAMPVQQAQARDARGMAYLLERLAWADSALIATPKDSPIWAPRFDRREAYKARAVACDPVAYVRAYPSHAFAYRHLLPADMVARIEAAETDSAMVEAVREPAPLNEGRRNSTNADGTPRAGWFDAACVNASNAPYLALGAIYRLREVRNGWFETEGGDRMAQFRFAKI